MMVRSRNNVLLMGWVALALVTGLAGCGGKDSAGYRNDSQPVAVATVLDAGHGDDFFTVRSGSDVLLSAKDSDGIDDPILQFEWRVLSASTNTYSPAQLQTMLVERTNSTKLFRAPQVAQTTRVIFELEVTDADGEKAQDTVAIDISPVGDSNTFLLQGAAGNNLYNQYELVVALDLAPGEVTASGFEVLIETLVEWEPRISQADCTFGASGNFCQMLMSTQTITGTWPSGLTFDDLAAENAATSLHNPHFYISLPELDLNEINKQFESVNRDKRLDLHHADTAVVKQRFSFISADNSARLLILNADGTADTGLLNLSSSATSAAVINVSDIQQKKSVESALSAKLYYQLIDPEGEADTLAKWLSSRGFDANAVSEPDFAHAIYVNNYDLGFGRDMFMRKDECGNVYSYVENYPTLETAIQKQNNFATVVMEYSTLRGEQGDSCSTEPKFVKFFAYVPDITTGARKRMENMNFDGRGEKYLPGVCTACHGGTPFELTAFAKDLPLDANLAEVVAALTTEERFELADLNATFMPFDLDALLYTTASDSRYTAPSLNPDNFTQAQIEAYSKSNQAAAMRTFNKNVLHTYLSTLAQLAEAEEAERERWYAPVALINTWYNTNITALENLNQIDTASFNGDAVLPGWVGNEALYHDVFALYCRSCHMQVANTARNFLSAEQFLDSNDPASFARMQNEVFKLGRMPLARLTADRFWVSFYGEESGADKLKAHMGVEQTPGKSVADFAIDNERPDEEGVRVTMDARFSAAFADTYHWSLVSDCGSSPLLSNSNTAVASFVVEQSPCNYTATLVTNNSFGADERSKVIVVDKIPESVSFNASLNDGTYPYTPGDASLTIDIDSYILERGDNDLATTMTVVVNDPADADLSLNPNLVNNNNGTVTLHFSALAGTEQSVEYKVEDFNGSRSARGVISVNIEPIIPQLLAPLEVLSTSATIGWTVPQGFIASSYNIYRDEALFDGDYQLIADALTASSYEDTNLNVNASYRYQVAAVLNGVESERSNMIDVSTVISVPAGLAAAPTSATSIALSWTINPLDPPDSYQVFENQGVTPIASLANQSYVRTQRTPNTQYLYQIAAVYSGYVSPRSTSASATTPPVAPTGLAQLEASRTTSAIRLQWSDNTNGGNPSYELRCLPTAGTTQTNVTSAMAQTFSALPSNTTYNCSVRTQGLAANSAYTSPVAVRTKVSYNQRIMPSVVTAQACVGCHVTHDAAFVRDSLLTNPCFSSANSASYGSCASASMAGLGITDAQVRTDLHNWRLDGGPN